jgi:hypothetical protein
MREALVRFARGTLLAVSAGVLLVEPLSARSIDKACKGIREAVGAGRTLDQIMRDFDVDAARVMKCVQPKGRRRKVKKGPPKAVGGGAARQRSGAAAPAGRNPSAPSSGPASR